MPYEIKFDMPPAGYSVSTARGGENVKVSVIEFTSSEDGDLFVSRLEGFPSQIIAKLPLNAKLRESQVDNLLVIIRQDNTATVYINELNIAMRTRVNRSVGKGEPIFKNDIVDIDEIKFDGIEIPDDAGFAFLFSHGWRKAFYYDFKPLTTTHEKRDYDVNKILGHYYNYLLFQGLFKITEGEWKGLFEQQWFPFVSLKNETTFEILNHLRAGWNIDDLLEKITAETNKLLDPMLERWGKHSLFADHFPILEKGIERYRSDDHISCTAIIYPRIEGIIRTVHQKIKHNEKATQKNLVDSLDQVGAVVKEKYSRLLPQKFVEYIEQIYFANFVPGVPTPVSRNTVSHGVASAADFSLKAATIGLLIIDQIFYHLPPDEPRSKP
jgi:hypothetical protein